MSVTINYLAVILAALSTMIVGSIWYAPKVFGNVWMKLGNITPNLNFPKKKMMVLYVGAFLSSLVTAVVIAYFAEVSHKAFNGSFLVETLDVGLIGWAGLTAARLYMHDSFEGRRKKLTLLNVTHELVTLMVMAAIIGLLGA